MIIRLNTRQKTQMVDVTRQVQQGLDQLATGGDGLCLIYVPHTTAAVTINESADPAVAADILKVLNTIVPFEAGYRHLEGNSAAHAKSTLVGASQTVAVADGRLVLGTWQGIFFCEFDGPRARTIEVRFIPSGG